MIPHNERNHRGRKGDLFMMGLDMLFLIALILIFWKLSAAFTQQNAGEGIGMRQAAVLHTYAMSEDMLLYTDETARFAAFESFFTTMQAAGINPDNAACGDYAGYHAWSAAGKTCFPTRQQLLTVFSKEFQKNLAAMMRHPGIPAGIQYAIRIDTTAPALLTIIGTTQDMIALPIVGTADQGTTLAQLTTALYANNVAGVMQGTFLPDTKLQNVQVIPSPNRKQRQAGIAYIIIHSSGTDDAQSAMDSYQNGLASTHYLISQDGSITQLVPEDQVASHTLACDTSLSGQPTDPGESCTLKNPDESSIGITLVNPGASDETPVQNSDGTYRCGGSDAAQLVPLKKTDWCSTKYYDAYKKDGIAVSCSGPEYGVRCWYKYTPAQLDALTKLVTDIVSRRDLDVNGVLLEDQLREASESPGPALLADGQDQKAWFASFIAGVVKAQAALNTQQASSSSSSSSSAKAQDAVTTEEDIAPPVPQEDLLPGQLPQQSAQTVPRLTTQDVGSGTSGAANSANPTDANSASAANAASAAPSNCSLNIAPASASGDKAVTATLANIDAQPGLLAAIQKAATEENLDYRLLIAMATQESSGKADSVSPTGCLGLFQFCKGTAQSAPYNAVFGPGLQSCHCPSSGSCHAQDANCASDPRADAYKSAKAGAMLLNSNIALFKGKTDQVAFGIASYNAGSVVINEAIAKTGNPDPSWAQVSAAIDDSVIYDAYCVKTGFNSACKTYFSTPAQQAKKVAEIQGYFPSILRHYLAQGGSMSTVISAQSCGGISVKEFGTYTFAPSFSTTVTDQLGGLGRAASFAQQVYGACDGSGGMDTRACLKDKLAAGTGSQDLSVVACEAGANATLESLKETIQDCKDNGQADCTCAWTPPKDLPGALAITLYGDAPLMTVDGTQVGETPPGAAAAMYQQSAKDAPASVMVTLYSDKDKIEYHVGVQGPGGVTGTTTAVKQFVMRKTADGGLVWMADAGDYPACGVYKTTHPVCIQYVPEIPRLSAGGYGHAVIKFALYLDDKHPPDTVQDLKITSPPADLTGGTGQFISAFTSFTGTSVVGDLAVEYFTKKAGQALEGVPLSLSFTPSQSADVSYYKVSCAQSSKDFVYNVSVEGRDRSKDPDIPLTITISATLAACAGQPVTPGQCVTYAGSQKTVNKDGCYKVQVVPVDISGNLGQPAVYDQYTEESKTLSGTTAIGTAGATAASSST